MNINFGNFISNLHYMLSGMVTIFIVIGIIVIITMLLNKFSNYLANRNEE
ncbi:MAG: oxaloacetate decarboxylase [Ruminococcaceae bacterium]|nr:oxaloacetate decarboxylase [Oscillospiraceae bacterium]